MTYKQWYSLLLDAGRVSGRDPVATFLAQVSRLEDVEHVGGRRSGIYQLRKEDLR